MRISNKQKEIIKLIGLSTLAISAVAMPGLAYLLKVLKPIKYYEKANIKRSFKDLVNKNIIFLSGEKVKLSKKGIKLYKRYEIEDIAIKKQKTWNGIWHLVSYDIPEKYKKQRDYFRFIIRNLGFLQIQDSLWVIPWECKEEIAIICQNIGVQPFVVYMNTKEIPDQERKQKKFQL